MPHENNAVDDAHLDAVLVAVGRDPKQLSADVERLQERRRLAALWARWEQSDARSAELARQIEKANQDFIAAQQRHALAIAQLKDEQQAAMRQSREIEAAREKLRATADPALRQRSAELADRVRELYARTRDIGRVAEQLRGNAQLKLSEAGETGNAGQAERLQAEAAAHEARAADHDRLIDDLREQIAELQAEQSRILDAMLTP
jgi:DNA repair exonuclease SbcCD ATPase subunit